MYCKVVICRLLANLEALADGLNIVISPARLA